MVTPQKLGHVVLRVSDLQKSVDFYTKFLGMHVLEEDHGEHATFLGLRDLGNTLDLVVSSDPAQGRAHRELRPIVGVGMHHFAFEVETQEELKEAYFLFKENNVRVVATLDHGSNQSLYFNDPDDNLVEFYWNRPDGWEKRLAGSVDYDEQISFD